MIVFDETVEISLFIANHLIQTNNMSSVTVAHSTWGKNCSSTILPLFNTKLSSVTNATQTARVLYFCFIRIYF